MHDALQAGLDKISELVSEEDWLIAATCSGLLRGYHERWQEEQANITVESIEGCYTAPLTNLETGRTSRTYTTAGKLDKLARDSRGLILVDHKTTSMDITDPTAPYWRMLTVDSQGSHYELLLMANGIKIADLEWDVTRKPGIKPKQLAKKDYRILQEVGTYCGTKIPFETIKALSEGDREGAVLYEARLTAEVLGNPDRYYARRSNTRTRQQLAEYGQELWGTSKLIREAELGNYHYRNPGACYSYGVPCRFLPLCSDVDVPESTNWQKKPKKNPELPDGVGGATVLTNSRVQCFNTCRRKHYYEYEMGIERVDAERREALYFGTVWSEALDAWWQTFDEGVSNGSSQEPQAR